MRQKFIQGASTGFLAALVLLACLHLWHQSPREKLKRALRIPGKLFWNQTHSLRSTAYPGVSLEELRMESGKDSTTAFWLTPQNIKPGQKLPAVILMHGHFSKAFDFIEPRPGKLKPLGLELAREGFAVLIPQARYETSDLKEETRQASQLLLTGKTLMGERVADVLRCLNYLRHHPLVETKKIGILGWSMGGSIALYAAALDPALRAVYVSGSAGSLQVALLPETPLQSADNYVPFLLKDFGDKADLFRLITPRPVLIEHGRNDNTEPPGGVMLTYEGARPAYERARAQERLELFWHEGGHPFDGTRALAWFQRWISPKK